MLDEKKNISKKDKKGKKSTKKQIKFKKGVFNPKIENI